MKLNFLKKPFILLMTVPAIIAMGIGILPPLIVYLELTFLGGSYSPFILQFSADTSRSILTAVAAGAMTALSLCYSLVLVVFTLAAANIGPRLLKRFTSDIVNQVTAGIFGGTFLYSIFTLVFIHNDFVPKFTIFGSGLLATLCVLQLIYFVSHVSRSVTIDDEIAEITDKLKQALEDGYSKNDKEIKEEIFDSFEFEIKSKKPGYVASIDEEELVELARDHNLKLRLECPMGHFILEDEILITASKNLNQDAQKAVRELVEIQPSRSIDSKIEFSINLLVEISLRALSPGVNDTFTALAAVDSLSNALAKVANGSAAPALCKDSEGEIRLITPSLSVDELVDQAFSPLRRASGKNILMAQGLARAYARLCASGNAQMSRQIEKHSKLLIKELQKAKHFDEDLLSVVVYLPRELQQTVND